MLYVGAPEKTKKPVLHPIAPVTFLNEIINYHFRNNYKISRFLICYKFVTIHTSTLVGFAQDNVLM